MSVWSDLRERVRGLLQTNRADRELDDELRFHMDMDVTARMRQGSSREDALRAATRAFGGVDRYREETRDARGIRPLGDLAHDVRYALRTLRRNRGFTLAALFVLGLGIAANTSIFSAVNALILRPLPFPQPTRLYMLWEENPEFDWYQQIVAPANLLDWRERVRAFEDVAGYTTMGSMVLSGRGEPRVLGLAQVTGNFFDVLGARAQSGRVFKISETWESGERTVVISHRLWLSLGSQSDIVSKRITLDGLDYRVVGVMPQGFAFPAAEVDVWVPTRWEPANRTQVWFRRAHWLRAIARLRPGVDPLEANAQLQAVVKQLQQEYPETNRIMGAGMTPLQEFLLGSTRRPLLVLLGAVAVLLLIGCANVGNLLLVKAAGRQRELAVRSALGAGRFRLIRQLMTESLVLSLLGGAFGLLLGVVGTRFLIQLQPEGLLPDSRFTIDLRVLAFVTAVTIVCGLVFGSVPAVWARRAGAAAALKEGGRSGMLGRSARAIASALLVGEVALALLLVVGAGLLVRSFQQLLQVDPGFDPQGVLAVEISLPDAQYDAGDKIQVFYESLLERASSVPGVLQAAAISTVPLTGGGYTSGFVVAGQLDEIGAEVMHRTITAEYLRTMRVPLLRGRRFAATDQASSEPVLIINQALATSFFKGRDPIGQRMAFDRKPDSTTTWYTIVGVAGSERQKAIAREPQIEVLHPFTQARNANMSLVLRTSADPLILMPGLEQVVRELDPNLPLVNVRSMQAVRAESMARERFLMVLLLVFSGVALVLAVVGTYGVTSQITRQRTQEIGVRLALGAQPGDVLRMMVGRGAILLSAGIALGITAALAATRVMTGLLFNITPIDPLTFGAVAAALALAGLIATWLPARRASRTDPGIALRPE